MEIWKPVKNYEIFYLISNLGNIQSLNRKVFVKREKKSFYSLKKGKMLKPKLTMDGYYEVTLFDSFGKRKYIRLHIIVLSNFIKKPIGDLEVNHKDGNKLNNHLENLEWVTKSENQIHAIKKGLICHQKGDKRWNAKITNEDAKNILKIYKLGEYSQAELARKYNVSKNIIWRLVNRKCWKHIYE